jgi:hypothetical protein
MNLRLLMALGMGAIVTGACVAGEDKTFKDAITGLSRKDFINKVMKYGILHEQFKRDCMPVSIDKNGVRVKDEPKDTMCAQLVDQIWDNYVGLFPDRKDAFLEEPFNERGYAVGNFWEGAQAGAAARRYYWKI